MDCMSAGHWCDKPRVFATESASLNSLLGAEKCGNFASLRRCFVVRTLCKKRAHYSQTSCYEVPMQLAAFIDQDVQFVVAELIGFKAPAPSTNQSFQEDGPRIRRRATSL